MTVREFARHHPAEGIDVISSEGCVHLTPKHTLALARDQPDSLEVLDWDVGHSSFSGGAWHLLAVAPALEQGPELKLAMA